MKIAAIEAMWETEPAPASLTLIGFPDATGREVRFAIKVPWVLGLIATRSLDEKVIGIADLLRLGEQRIRSGLVAYRALLTLQKNGSDAAGRGAIDPPAAPPSPPHPR